MSAAPAETELLFRQVLDAVRDVLALRGDAYVYGAEDDPDDDADDDDDDPDFADGSTGVCWYSADGGATGDCLFGAALLDVLHVPYDASWEGQGIYTVLTDCLGVTVPEDAQLTLHIAQAAQDSGEPYREVRARLAGSWPVRFDRDFTEAVPS